MVPRMHRTRRADHPFIPLPSFTRVTLAAVVAGAATDAGLNPLASAAATTVSLAALVFAVFPDFVAACVFHARSFLR
jgi:hypothetical protein